MPISDDVKRQLQNLQGHGIGPTVHPPANITPSPQGHGTLYSSRTNNIYRTGNPVQKVGVKYSENFRCKQTDNIPGVTLLRTLKIDS
jgi:hypothetical protein